MMLAFILIAGTLAAGAALLVLLPLMRQRSDSHPAAGLTAGVLLLSVLLGGAGLYAALSNYTWTDDLPAVADTPASRAAKLARQLAREPDNLEGWLMLGRTYGMLEQFPLAMRAYQRADRIANGQNSEALMGVAESLLAQDANQISGAAGQLFERALQIDPRNPKALFYSAFTALGRNDLPVARERFSGMLALDPRQDIRQIIERQISAIDAAAGGEGVKVAVRVTLAPNLLSRVPAGSILFVAARDPQSPGPPFAVKRLPAVFPVDVELSAADAMLETRRIAQGQQLEVVARVALGGSPTATRGDPFGQVSYHVGKDGLLNIVIDRLAD